MAETKQSAPAGTEPKQLSRAEQIALLGREPYSGDFDGYLRVTGRRF